MENTALIVTKDSRNKRFNFKRKITTIINKAEVAAETIVASGMMPSVLTFQIWTAKVSAGRITFKKLVGLNGFQLL